MHDDIDKQISPPSLAFKMQIANVYSERIPKAAKMKRMPTWKQHKGT